MNMKCREKYQARKSRGSFPSIVPLLTSGTLVKSGLDSGLHAPILGNESRVRNVRSAPGKPSGNRVMSSEEEPWHVRPWFCGALMRCTEEASQRSCSPQLGGWMGLEITKALPQSHVPRVNHHPAMNDIPKG